MRMKTFAAGGALMVLALVALVVAEEPAREGENEELPRERVTESGLRIVEVARGEPEAKEGDTVWVHYTGRLEDGTVFDSSRERGQPIEFPLGRGRVIRGWDEGIQGMKIGDQRQLIIPPELGYGAQGVPGVIPANATLVFDVELMGTRRP